MTVWRGQRFQRKYCLRLAFRNIQFWRYRKTIAETKSTWTPPLWAAFSAMDLALNGRHAAFRFVVRTYDEFCESHCHHSREMHLGTFACLALHIFVNNCKASLSQLRFATVFSLYGSSTRVSLFVNDTFVISSSLHTSSTAGSDICGEIEGHKCMNRSCCPFDDVDSISNTPGLCTEDGETAVCCNRDADCHWKEDLKQGPLLKSMYPRLFLKGRSHLTTTL